MSSNLNCPKESVADAAGEFRSVAIPESERNHRHFNSMVAATKRMALEAGKRGEILTRGLDSTAPSERCCRELSGCDATAGQPITGRWAKGGGGAVPPSMVDGRPIDYWSALSC